MDIIYYPNLETYKIRENTGSRSSNGLVIQISFSIWNIFELYQGEEFTVAIDCIDDRAIFKTSNEKTTIKTY